MNRQSTDTQENVLIEAAEWLRFLSESQVRMIDEALLAVGEFGEVRLVIQKGRIRYVVVEKSHDALKWEAGDLRGGSG
jgi:hypothetical protein